MNGINQSKRTQKWKEKLVENGPNLPPKSRKNVAKLMQNGAKNQRETARIK